MPAGSRADAGGRHLLRSRRSHASRALPSAARSGSSPAATSPSRAEAPCSALSEVRLGLIPAVIGPYLVRAVGARAGAPADRDGRAHSARPRRSGLASCTRWSRWATSTRPSSAVVPRHWRAGRKRIAAAKAPGRRACSAHRRRAGQRRRQAHRRDPRRGGSARRSRGLPRKAQTRLGSHDGPSRSARS